MACLISLDGPGRAEPTTTPPADQVVHFLVPILTISLNPGETIPGTQLTYVNKEEDIFNVTIDGLAAVKRIGDSFIWKGIIAPGVLARYNLRVSPTLISDNMLVAGPIEFWVLNPAPVEVDASATLANARHHFSNIAVDLTVPKGQGVPGTSLFFVSTSDQGAEFAGTGAYPYHAVGDSLVWSGRLRGNVVVRYSLRVVSVNENSVRLAGTAEIWLLD